MSWHELSHMAWHSVCVAGTSPLRLRERSSVLTEIFPASKHSAALVASKPAVDSNSRSGSSSHHKSMTSKVSALPMTSPQECSFLDRSVKRYPLDLTTSGGRSGLQTPTAVHQPFGTPTNPHYSRDGRHTSPHSFANQCECCFQARWHNPEHCSSGKQWASLSTYSWYKDGHPSFFNY